MTADGPAHRGISRQTLGVVHVLTAAKHGVTGLGFFQGFCAFISGSSAQRLTCTVSGTTVREVDMKIPVLIVLALVLLGTGGTLAFMNNACKSSQHSWCASDLRHHAKAGRS
jgi:hypothetical protein